MRAVYFLPHTGDHGAQLRSALALASTLDRILIMPKLWCLLDRWWAPHEGRIPGTSGPPPGPFVCPLDHVLNLERMAANFSMAEFGPHVHWREYSFLSNPRLPRHVARCARVRATAH